MSEPNLVKTKEDKMKDFYLFEELFETLEGRKEYEKLVERSKRKREESALNESPLRYLVRRPNRTSAYRTQMACGRQY